MLEVLVVADEHAQLVVVHADVVLHHISGELAVVAYVVVYEVESGSCAEAAGLKSQDIILEFDNVKVTSSAELKYELYRHNVGDTVTIKVNRNGFEKDLKITLKK